MRLLYYLYYKVYKTYNRIDKIVKLYWGPRNQTDSFISLFILSVPLCITIKLGLWNWGINAQFLLTFIFALAFFGIGLFVEKKIRTKAIGLYKNETKAQSFIGAIAVNLFIIIYTLFGFFLLK